MRSVLALPIGLALACSSAPTSPEVTGRAFQAVVSGRTMTGALTGSVDIVTDEDLELSARFAFADTRFALAGSVEPSGNFRASGGGWLFSGAIDRNRVTGDLTGPGGAAGTIAGLDADLDGVGRFCGTYSGGGTWNLVLAGGGTVTGSFAGSAAGRITGRVDGDTISLEWEGSSAVGSVTGTAGGTLDAAKGRIVGVYKGKVKGSLGDFELMGSFVNEANCPGSVEPCYRRHGGKWDIRQGTCCVAKGKAWSCGYPVGYGADWSFTCTPVCGCYSSDWTRKVIPGAMAKDCTDAT